MAIIVSTGARTYFGYAAEATPGVPVAASEYLPVSASPTLDYDPGRKPLEVAAGDLVIDRYLTEDGGKVSGHVEYPLFSTLGQALTALCGIGVEITAPAYLTAEIYRAGQSFQYAGLLPKSWKLEAKAKSHLKVTVEFDGLGIPTFIAPSIDPATYVYPADQPFMWAHAQPVLTPGSGAVATSDIDGIEVMATIANSEYYGANGTTMPQEIVPGPISVSAKHTRLFRNTDDWDHFVQVGQTPGTLQYRFVHGARSVTLTMPGAYSTKLDLKGDLKSPIVQDVSYGTLPSAGTLLSYVAA